MDVTLNGIRYTRRDSGTWAAGDSCYRVGDITSDALDEIIRLRKWKSEATIVLGYWDDAFERSGIDGLIGDHKPKLMADEIIRMRAANEHAWAELRNIADQNIRLRARIRELDQALSDAEHQLANPGN